MGAAEPDGGADEAVRGVCGVQWDGEYGDVDVCTGRSSDEGGGVGGGGWVVWGVAGREFDVEIGRAPSGGVRDGWV